MLSIPAEQLIVSENRQRRDFDEDELGKLADSILSKGLMHPLVVRKEGDKFHLVAGERRMRAMALNHLLSMPFTCNGVSVGKSEYPCILLSSLTPYQIEEAELEENLLRADLTWQEEASAVARLHKLREAQKVEKGERPQTYKETASELGDEPSLPSSVRDNVILADHLDEVDIQKAGSKKEAIKLLRKKMQRQVREKQAENFQFNGEANHQLYIGDSIDVMKKLDANSIDVILTDPPYAINAQNFGSQCKTKHNYQDSEADVWNMLEEFAALSSLVTKERAHLYLFCDIRHFPRLQKLFTSFGWDVFQTPFIWYRGQHQGFLPRPEHGPRRTYEAILYAIKGNREVITVGSDVLNIPSENGREHGAQKPVELFSQLLARSVNPGDLVADFFCGSGPIFPAAEKNHCKSIGVELDGGHAMLAQARIDAINSEG